MDERKPTIEDISRHYDLMTEFYHIVLGESIHVGYWPDPAEPLELPVAQECYTDLMIQRMPLQPGQRLLDVGCGTGQPAVRLAQATDGLVVGITINRNQVERATLRGQASGVTDRAVIDQMPALFRPIHDIYTTHIRYLVLSGTRV
ncbi:MAG: SAM-dependent methyltransferase [Chloroflexaceae bacterium]